MFFFLTFHTLLEQLLRCLNFALLEMEYFSILQRFRWGKNRRFQHLRKIGKKSLREVEVGSAISNDPRNSATNFPSIGLRCYSSGRGVTSCSLFRNSTTKLRNKVHETLPRVLGLTTRYSILFPVFALRSLQNRVQYVAQFSYGPSFRTKRTLSDYFRRSFKSSSTEEFQK